MSLVGLGGSLSLSCYVIVGAALAVQLARDAYLHAALVCELYPSFPFGETLLEELLGHATRLPGLGYRVSTLVLLAFYALALVVVRLQLLERVWLLLAELHARRPVHYMLFELLPAWLPFLASEPEVPELLSEEEGETDDLDGEDAIPALPVNATEFSRALEKLVQVKLRFADHRVERPDGWLVFDPLAAELVLQKKVPQSRGAEQMDDQNANEDKDKDADCKQNGPLRGAPPSAIRSTTSSSSALEATLEPQLAVDTAESETGAKALEPPIF